MVIRRLIPADARVYQQLRLEGLRESSPAFGSSFADEVKRTVEEIEARLPIGDDALVAVFGAFVDGRLAGMAALVRTSGAKFAHNATVCGMYVSPGFRRQRIGAALLDTVVAHARTFAGLRNLRLTVNATNVAAIRLYRSRGFTLYGLEREALFVDGVYYDEELYALSLMAS